MPMRIESPAFSEGGAIPSPFTCDGRNVSPALSWSEVPAGTKSLALICDDPDAPAGVWVHWVAYGVPPGAGGFAEGIAPAPDLAGGGLQGRNDFGKLGYGGPCPPKGTHRYEFKLYALDIEPKLESGATKAQLLRAMHGHVLAEAKLTGKYTRR
jgi:Raf kinase inhibitor-like YbhB/YbcL family protein